MPPTNTRKLRLIAEEQGLTQLKKQVDGVDRSIKKSSKSWVQSGVKAGVATAATAAGLMLVREAWESVNDSARRVDQLAVFDRLAVKSGTSSTKVRDDVRAITRSLSDQEIARFGNTLDLLGVGIENLPKLAEVARASAAALGKDVPFMLESIATGTARQSRLWLDNLGIIISVEEANKRYAQQLGKTASQLTDTETRAAFLNAVLEKGDDIIEKVGLTSATNTEKVDSLSASWSNFTDNVSELVVNSGVIDFLDGLAMGIDGVNDAIKNGTSTKIDDLIGQLPEDQAEEFTLRLRARVDSALAQALGNPQETLKEILADLDLAVKIADAAQPDIAPFASGQFDAEAEAAAQLAAEKRAKKLAEIQKKELDRVLKSAGFSRQIDEALARVDPLSRGDIGVELQGPPEPEFSRQPEFFDQISGFEPSILEDEYLEFTQLRQDSDLEWLDSFTDTQRVAQQVTQDAFGNMRATQRRFFFDYDKFATRQAFVGRTVNALLARGAGEVGKAFINARAEQAKVDAANYAADALALLALGDFGGFATMSLAAAKKGAIAGLATVGTDLIDAKVGNVEDALLPGPSTLQPSGDVFQPSGSGAGRASASTVIRRGPQTNNFYISITNNADSIIATQEDLGDFIVREVSEALEDNRIGVN